MLHALAMRETDPELARELAGGVEHRLFPKAGTITRFWWSHTRRESPEMDPVAALRRVASLLGQPPLDEEARPWLEETGESAAHDPEFARPAPEIAEAWANAGRVEDAIRFLESRGGRASLRAGPAPLPPEIGWPLPRRMMPRPRRARGRGADHGSRADAPREGRLGRDDRRRPHPARPRRGGRRRDRARRSIDAVRTGDPPISRSVPPISEPRPNRAPYALHS